MWPVWDQHTARGCTGSGTLRKESKAMAFHLSASTLGNHRCHLCWLGLNPTSLRRLQVSPGQAPCLGHFCNLWLLVYLQKSSSGHVRFLASETFSPSEQWYCLCLSQSMPFHSPGRTGTLSTAYASP